MRVDSYNDTQPLNTTLKYTASLLVEDILLYPGSYTRTDTEKEYQMTRKIHEYTVDIFVQG